MFKGVLILVFGGIIGSIFGILAGALLGFFGGAIFYEMAKDEGRNESRYSGGGRINYEGMRTPPRPVHPEPVDEPQ